MINANGANAQLKDQDFHFLIDQQQNPTNCYL